MLLSGETPQGAPTSPVLSNLICEILDFRILKIAKHYKLDYTRYADDLTFSTNDKTFCSRYDAFYQQLQKEIRRAGFAVNEKKDPAGVPGCAANCNWPGG